MEEQSSHSVATPEEPSVEWIVVSTKPRQEKIAARHLMQRQVEPYCPLFLMPRWHKRAPRGPVPLFAGYIFVRCDPIHQLNAVRFCPGVLAPVAFNRQLATVEESVIQALLLQEGERGYILPREVTEGIARGSKVRIMEGPLTGLEGVFTGYLRGRQRARVLMEFLRTRQEIELDAAALAPLHA